MRKILVIPSIDIKDRKTVRIVQGIPELDCKAYGNDPVEMAMIWRSENAKVIHVVDFDLSREHSRKNLDLIGQICESVIIPIEFGGGITNIADAEEILNLGVFRLVIGSLAFSNPKEFKRIFEKFGPLKISAAIDVINEELVVHARKEKAGISAIEFSKQLSEIGINRFVITDVLRNGMMDGPNIEFCRKIADATNTKVTLSGGISGFSDLMKVQENYACGIDSVIVGRALYENKFPCQKIWRVAESGIFD
ncbi:MAG: 1-(5-phosphoribosyl)-5-[(5-phosphoribosylamino)methylideneamino] imidazole-4-carboxamide isomerase [Ignavibacteriales bacterium]|nr:1-(5-phosphoribosyl)-5-[(5-phosphoribosylamino)methylideneamino] imidazole-4-carboxamide isomerase [Ignavibacteriales bacterium]MBK7979813.1 1-(5-phosphoribosyl)-5-[(5-phosphoribosylamino)methylideneamino] imidazole-4-carboxamide isomerase [Ignavibacteriota bacterium]